jgi:hypothetical protein
METELMATTIDRNSVLVDTLARFRGAIVDARIAYPEVLHLDVRDEEGALWQFATQDASWLPRDPVELRHKTIVAAEIDWDTGTLRCELSEGSAFTVIPAPQEEADDPPNWELFMPNGLLLDFGPGARWRIGDPRELDESD